MNYSVGTRGKKLAGAILLSVFAIAAWEILRERQPVYEGRKLSAWVKDGLMGDNRAWRVLMIQPGHHRSEEFVPYAIEALQTLRRERGGSCRTLTPKGRRE
jgi:hypothetical protein